GILGPEEAHRRVRGEAAEVELLARLTRNTPRSSGSARRAAGRRGRACCPPAAAASLRRASRRTRHAKRLPRSGVRPGLRARSFRYSSRVSLRAYRLAPTDATTFHPRLIGRRGAVACNSYLSANAGADVLKAGGNAIDAAVAATLVEGLVNPQ